MPGWYYDKKELRNTPSATAGLDFKTEMRYRKEGKRFRNGGPKLCSLHHRHWDEDGLGVQHDSNRRGVFPSLLHVPLVPTVPTIRYGLLLPVPGREGRGDAQEVQGHHQDCQDLATRPQIHHLWVMTLERILLQTIKFDLQVEHPYQFLLKYAKCLKGDKAKLQKMVQMAWTFVNDSLCTTLCLQWEPEIIAVALMYLAGKLSKFEVMDWVGRSAKHLRWWDMFVEDVTMDLLEDICHQVLDLYSQPAAAKSPPESPPLSGEKAPISPKNAANGNERTQISPEQPPVPALPRLPPPADVPQFPYQTFTHAPPPLASYAPVSFPAPPVNTPPPAPPHIAGPPPNVFPPYVNHPPPFPAVGPPPPYFGNGLPPSQSQHPHRQYFQPS
ncbi:hypothetical protein YQE_02536, partial [Dendroctonus ponderosae]